MKVLFATSEAAPYIKSGGLADVLGSLPKALVAQGVESYVVLPKYQDMKFKDDLEFVCHYDIWVSWRKEYCGVFKTVKDGVTFYFIDNEKHFGRPGLYGYDDDNERFAFFDFAVLELMSHIDLKPDIIHLQDWQTAMIAPLYKERYQYYDFYKDIKVIFTIHNIAYQGKCDMRLLSELFGLGDHLYYNGNVRHNNCLNMMKAAIVYSDLISTVSPTYAEEILTSEYGHGLESVLDMRRHDLVGILNGIDYEEFNPATDTQIATNFDTETVIKNKPKNKAALQKELGLPVNKDAMLIGIVTRLTWQKGLDIILEKLNDILQREVQIVVLGAGDREYENSLNWFAHQYPAKFSAQLKYDFGLSCRIYASCDLFLMPSLFEPCGLSQMMSLRYGTIPLVRETGGLRDSVIPYNEYEKTGTGFSFKNYNGQEMLNAIDYSLYIYSMKDHWNDLVVAAMKAKLDWDNSASQYISMYHRLAGK